MEERQVNWIDIPFIGLEIIALRIYFRGESILLRDGKYLVGGQEWGFPRSQVSENESSCFMAGIRLLPDVSTGVASIGFARLVQALPLHVIEPSMIDAAESSVFHSPVTQICATVSTVNIQQTRLTLIIPKEDKVLAKKPNGLRGSTRGQLFGKGQGLPVASQQLTRRGPGTHSGQQIILLLSHHRVRLRGISFTVTGPIAISIYSQS